MESLAASPVEAMFADKRRAALDLLGLDPESGTILGVYQLGIVELFTRLLLLSDEQVLGVLGLLMGESLQVGSDPVEATGVHIGVDMVTVWEADDALFELIRDREVLTAIVAETVGEDAATANAGQKGKILKAIIRDALAGVNGRSKVDGWVPRWLRFPASGYTVRGRPSLTD